MTVELLTNISHIVHVAVTIQLMDLLLDEKGYSELKLVKAMNEVKRIRIRRCPIFEEDTFIITAGMRVIITNKLNSPWTKFPQAG